MDNSITILGQIILTLLGLFSTYIIFNFLSRFEREIYKKKYIYVIAYVLYTFIIIVIKSFADGTINLIITAALTALVGHLLYNRKKIFILYYSIFIIFLAVTQVISSFIFGIIWYRLGVNFYSMEVTLITQSIVIQIAVLGMSRLFIFFYGRKKIGRLSAIQFVNFLVLPVFSIFYITTLMMYVQVYLSPQDIILLIVNIVSILALNIFITNIFESISRNNELKNEILLYEQLSKIQYEYYSAIESKYNSSRKLIHDMKNHMHTIERLYSEKEDEKAREYAKDMYRMFEELGHKEFTANRVLNIILNDKYQKSASNGIELSCAIETLELDLIKDMDITTIFANLLDNAIDGAKDTNGLKVISLKVAKFNDFLVINISNNTSKEPVSDGEGFKSTKKGHSGLGLQNVRMALAKYQGSMRFSYESGFFTVNIFIPLV